MSDKNYKTRKLTDEEVARLFHLTKNPEDINLDLIKTLFAFTEKSPAAFQPGDYFTLKAGTFYNKKDERTCVGRFLFNRLILSDPKIGNAIGYLNMDMGGSGLGYLDSKMTDLLLVDILTVDEFSQYMDKIQWLGFATTKFMAPSLTTDLIILPKDVKERKAELLEKHAKAIAEADVDTIGAIEKELLDMAKKDLANVSDMAIYDSGSRGSYSNNYKQTAVGRGIVRSISDPDKLMASMASLEEGIPKEDIAVFADVLTGGSLSRAIGTKNGGYEAKKLSASFQGVKLGDKGSNCRTTRTVDMVLDKNSAKLLNKRYIMVKGKPVMLTPENMNDYIGKVIHLRSPMYCQDEKYCNICSGDLYYEMGVENVGLITNIIGSSLTTLSMKKMHNTSVQLAKMNPFDYIDNEIK